MKLGNFYLFIYLFTGKLKTQEYASTCLISHWSNDIITHHFWNSLLYTCEKEMKKANNFLVLLCK